ncbi:hypothetical protein DSUL_20073 [Desulfovibrionales bacterium]
MLAGHRPYPLVIFKLFGAAHVANVLKILSITLYLFIIRMTSLVKGISAGYAGRSRAEAIFTLVIGPHNIRKLANLTVKPNGVHGKIFLTSQASHYSIEVSLGIAVLFVGHWLFFGHAL